jgi:hypothetical protein
VGCRTTSLLLGTRLIKQVRLGSRLSTRPSTETGQPPSGWLLGGIPLMGFTDSAARRTVSRAPWRQRPRKEGTDAAQVEVARDYEVLLTPTE